MDKLLLKKTRECLEDLIAYVNKCSFDNYTLYSKVSTTFSYLGALFGNQFIKNPVNETDMLKNGCIAFNNAFKHSKELNQDYSDLNLLEYGTSLDFVLPAPFGDVVIYQLPHSNIASTISFARVFLYKAKENDIHGVLPDIEIPQEQALDFVLKNSKGTTIRN